MQWHPSFGQLRVQVDHVRHHGRADDADRQIQLIGAAQARDQPLQRGVCRGADLQRLVQKAREHDSEQTRDRELEATVAASLQLEDRERDHGRDQPGGQERHIEQQVEPDRRAQELGQVGRHRDQLGLDPQPPARPARESRPAQLRQALAGRDP